MKKIPTIFKRNPENMKEILEEAHDDCHWVFNGEGLATRKYDGTCCMIENKILYKRREVKKGKPEPEGYIKLSTDPNTGKSMGWVAVNSEDKGDQFHVEAMNDLLEDGTYELLGPKIQGNPEDAKIYYLLKHSEAEIYDGVPRTFKPMMRWLEDKNIEGLVFQHPDGRMAKIKKRDFGLKRV